MRQWRVDLDALRLVLKIAELGSLSRAGEHLGLPRSRVSRRLKALEGELGVRLFHRTTRVVRPTPDGEALLPRARRLVREADELEALFRPGPRLRGRVRVNLPVNLARRFVLPALPDLLARHPDLELFVSTTDRLVDAVSEGFDCVLRVGEPAGGELVRRRLGELEMVSCVSREYVERRGAPASLEALSDHLLIHWASGSGVEAPAFEYEAGGETRTAPMPSAITVDGADAYRAACLAGLGVVQVPRIGVEAHLASGALVEILPEHRCAPMPVSLLHPHGRRLPARVRAVMDWIEAALAPALGASAVRSVPKTNRKGPSAGS